MNYYYAVTINLVVCIFQFTSGCHSPLHGFGNRPAGGFETINGLNPPGERPEAESPEDRIRDLLSGHGLPNELINCVVARQTRGNEMVPEFARFARSLQTRRKIEDSPNSEASLEEECRGSNRKLCEDVLECSDVPIPQLSFLTTKASTTTKKPPKNIVQLKNFPIEIRNSFCRIFNCKRK